MDENKAKRQKIHEACTTYLRFVAEEVELCHGDVMEAVRRAKAQGKRGVMVEYQAGWGGDILDSAMKQVLEMLTGEGYRVRADRITLMSARFEVEWA